MNKSIFPIILICFSIILYSHEISYYASLYEEGMKGEEIQKLFYEDRNDFDKWDNMPVILLIMDLLYEEKAYESIYEIFKDANIDHPLYYNLKRIKANALKQEKQYKDAMFIYYDIIHYSEDLILIDDALRKIFEIIKETEEYNLVYDLKASIDNYSWSHKFQELMRNFTAEKYIYEKNNINACKNYLKNYRNNPSNRNNINIRNTLRNIKDKRQLNQNDLLLYYVNNNDYKNAEKIFSEIYNKRKNIPFYSDILRTLKENQKYNHDANNLYQRIQRVDSNRARHEYERIFARYPYSYYTELAMFRYVVNHINSGDYNKAIAAYIHLADKRPFSGNYELFLIRIAVLYMLQDDYDLSIKYLDKLILSDINAFSAIGRYFMAKIYIMKKDYDIALFYLYQIYEINYNTYYSIKADELLKELIEKKRTTLLEMILISQKINPFNRNIEALINRSQFLYRAQDNIDERKRYKELAKEYINEYIKRIKERDKNHIIESGNLYYEKYRILKNIKKYSLYSPYLQYLHSEQNNAYITIEYMKALYENDYNLIAIMIGNRFINNLGIPIDFRLIPKEIQEILFPVRYTETIIKYSDKLDPMIVKSLIRQESGFNPRAVSPRRAMGLMQILPSTAFEVARRHRIPYSGQRDLFNEEINIRIGIKYFEDLYTRYNNINYALSAYNAGGRHANRWIRMYDGKDMDIYNFIITFRETREYVQLVLRNHLIYKSIINNE